MHHDDESLVPGRPIPPSGPAPEATAYRFGDDDISRILQKAAELQERAAAVPGESGRGLTLAELRQVALEAGIDPRFVDLAASDFGGDVETRESVLAGGTLQWHYHVAVPTEIDDGDRERILQTLRGLLGRKGTLEDVFGRMEWTYEDGLGPVIVGISSRDGVTDIDVTAARSGEAGMIHGLAIPFGGIAVGVIAAKALAISGPLVLPLIGVGGLASYVAARFSYGLRARWWEKRLQKVVSRLRAVVQSGGAGLPSRPSALPAPDRE